MLQNAQQEDKKPPNSRTSWTAERPPRVSTVGKTLAKEILPTAAPLVSTLRQFIIGKIERLCRHIVPVRLYRLLRILVMTRIPVAKISNIGTSLTDSPSTAAEIVKLEPSSLDDSTSKVRTFFLVDFENMGLEALSEIEKLDSDSVRICLFSTLNAPKIPMATLTKIFEFQRRNVDAFTIHIVPMKKQSVDMHLVSYLGYLIGVYGTSCDYVIRSSDRDYDNVVQYWKALEGVDVKRVGKLAVDQPTSSNQTTPTLVTSKSTPQSSAVKPQNVSKQTFSAPRTAAKTKSLKKVITELLTKAKVAQETIAEIVNIAAGKYDQTDVKQVLYNALTQKYGKQNGLRFYRLVKDVF